MAGLEGITNPNIGSALHKSLRISKTSSANRV